MEKQISMKDLSKKELNDIRTAHKAEMEAIDAEQKRRKDVAKKKRDVKAGYMSLVNPTRHRQVNEHIFFDLLKNIMGGSEQINLTREKYAELIDKSRRVEFLHWSKIYPCPYCGEFSLQAYVYDNKYGNPRHHIVCDGSCECDFSLKTNNSPDCGEKAAWWTLEDWLEKKGYLDKQKLNKSLVYIDD